MTLSSKLLGSGDKHMYGNENGGEDNYHWQEWWREWFRLLYIYS
jgi:hypothetical protein